MSLILGVRDDHDIVVASDGRVLDARCAVLSDDSLKTLALNEELCLGLAGSTDGMHHVLVALGIRCRGAHPVDMLRLCQETVCPVDIEYRDARAELIALFRWMACRTSAVQCAGWIPSVVLAGRCHGRPAVSRWAGSPRPIEAAGSAGYFEAVVGTYPGRTGSGGVELRRMVQGQGTTERAEERLTRAVRLAERSLGEGSAVGGTVCLRRLSHRFELRRADEAASKRET